jgi:hypothetical protein
MEQEGQIKKRARRKKRKTSPRPSRTLGRQKKPGVSSYMKARWQDPVYRAAMVEKRRQEALLPKRTRQGVPDGMRLKEATKLNEAAAESAKETMTELRKAGAIDGSDPRAEEALEQAVKIMRAPGDKKVQLAGARLVLEFTKSKPASKSDITVNKAEEWLAEVAATTNDAEAT